MANRTLQKLIDLSKTYDKAKYSYADFILLLCYIVSLKTIFIGDKEYKINNFNDLASVIKSANEKYMESFLPLIEYISEDDVRVNPCGRWDMYCFPFQQFSDEYITKLFDILSSGENPLETVEDYEYLINSVPLDYVNSKELSEKNNVSKLIDKLSEKKKNHIMLDIGIGSGISILNSIKPAPYNHFVIEPNTFGIQRLAIADVLFNKKQTIDAYDDEWMKEYISVDSNTPLCAFNVATYNRPLSKRQTAMMSYTLESGDDSSHIIYKHWEPLTSSLENEIHILNNLTCNIKNKVVMVVSNDLLFKKNQDYFLYRKGIVNNNCLEAVIQLPKDIFKYSHSKYSIIVINKNKKNEDVVLINLSSDNKYINKKGLTIKESAIEEIYQLIKNKANTKDSKVLDTKELEKNSYVILPEVYISKKTKELASKQPALNEQEIYEQLNEINNRIYELVTKMKGEY